MKKAVYVQRRPVEKRLSLAARKAILNRMNYLSHFHASRHHADASSPRFNVGVAFPDMMSGYGRRYRIQQKQLDVFSHDGLGVSFWNGVREHLSADAAFHNSPTFRQLYDETRVQLTRAFDGTAPFRLFFVAHVLIEVVFDHLLLLRYEDLARRFYLHFDEVSPSQLQSEAEAFFNTPLPGLSSWITDFTTRRYLESYANPENLIYPINHVLRRTNQPIMSPEHFRTVKRVAESNLRQFESALEKIFP